VADFGLSLLAPEGSGTKLSTVVKGTPVSLSKKTWNDFNFNIEDLNLH